MLVPISPQTMIKHREIRVAMLITENVLVCAFMPKLMFVLFSGMMSMGASVEVEECE